MSYKRPIEVVMRHCNGTSNPQIRPPGFSKEDCFKNFMETKDDAVNVTIFFDGDPSQHFISKYPVKTLAYTYGGSDAKSMRGLVMWLTQQQFSPDTIVYIVEDDFTHKSGWPTVLREAFSGDMKPTWLQPDYVTLYDHRDKYEEEMYKELQSKIGFTKTVHWRTVPSTVNTCAFLFKTFMQDAPIFYKYTCIDDQFAYDHRKFLELGEMGRTLVSCVPSYSTHTQNNVLAPCVDWSSFYSTGQVQNQTQNQQKTKPINIQEEFIRMIQHEDSIDIREHLPTLYNYAKQCNSILELGVRKVISSWAFINGLFDSKQQNTTLDCCDIVRDPAVSILTTACQQHNISHTFFESNDLLLDVKQQYDMIFIDTWHVYAQLIRELEKFHSYAKKYIVMHDTEVDGIYGESLRIISSDIPKQARESGFPEEEIRCGLKQAVVNFLTKHPEWKLKEHFINNNGLTILERV